MFPDPSPRVEELHQRLTAFMDEHIYPNEQPYYEQLQAGDRWQPPPLMEELKAKAKAAGLWNLFFSDSEYGAGLANLEYAPLCEIMGRSPIAPEAFNCSPPDTGTPRSFLRTSACRQKTSCSARGADSKSLRAGSDRAGFITACD